MTNRTASQLRAAIDAERQRRGMSISALAEAAGVSRAALSRYLGGIADMQSETIERLMGVLALGVRRVRTRD